MPTPPTTLDKLKQAAAILKAVFRADESCETAYEGYDATPALRAAVTLIEDANTGIAQEGDRCFRKNGRFPTRDPVSPLIEAECILKACIGMEATGADWGLTWAMLPAVRLIDEVIARRPPSSARAKRTKPLHGGNVVQLTPANS